MLGTEGYRSYQMLNSEFPGNSKRNPWIILFRCDKGVNCPGGDNKSSIVSEATKNIIDEIDYLIMNRTSGVFTEKINYFMVPEGLRSKFVNRDQTAMFAVWTSTTDAPQYDRFDAHDLLRDNMYRMRDKLLPGTFIGVTGVDTLGHDSIESIASTIIKADLITVPVAILILAYMVGTWRYILVTLFNLATVIFSSFAVMVYISKATVPPQGITPQFVEVMAMALTIDYSLFFFTRFISELEKKRRQWRKQREAFLRTRYSTAPQTMPSTFTIKTPTPTTVSFGAHANGRAPSPPTVASYHSGAYPITNSPLDRPGAYFGGGGGGGGGGGSSATGYGTVSLDDSDDVADLGLGGIEQNIEAETLTLSDHPLRSIVRAALYSTLNHSGHVIVVSGSTLLISFLGFFISECQFLYMPAIANVIMITICVIVSLTVTPAFIFLFPAFFTDFNLLPAICYRRCPSRRRFMLGDVDETGDEVEVEDPEIMDLHVREAATEASRFGTPTRLDTHDELVGSNRQSVPTSSSGPSDAEAMDALRSSSNKRASRYRPSARGPSAEERAHILQTDDAAEVREQTKMLKSLWFKMGKCLVRFPWNLIAVLITLGLTSAVAWRIFSMELSSSFDMGIPRSAPSMKTLRSLSESFSPGLIQPFEYMLHTQAEGTNIRNDAFFDAGWKIYEALKVNTTLTDDNIMSIFYYEGDRVDWTRAQELIEWDPTYGAMWLTLVNTNKGERSVLYEIQVPFNPETDMSRWFVNQVRASTAAADIDRTLYPTFFCGYKVYERDTIEYTVSKFPMMIAITTTVVMLVVAILLKSAFVPVRLLLTLIVPIAAVYGLAVLVYQDGFLNWLGWDALSNDIGGFYWDIPIFSFIVLLGLALDYDVFIISRIIEYRVQSYSNPAAIVLGLYDTGPIITAAGLIMAISFMSLFFMEAPAVQQIGWILVSAVLIDTFIVRSIVVPCVMSFADKIGWWPRQVPQTNLKDAEGSTAVYVEPNSEATQSRRWIF